MVMITVVMRKRMMVTVAVADITTCGGDGDRSDVVMAIGGGGDDNGSREGVAD